MAKDDDAIAPAPRKRAKLEPESSSGPSAPMLRLMRIARAIGILAGGLVTLVFFMSVVGLATDNVVARLVVGLVLTIGLPALLGDRLLKRTNMGGGLSLVSDVFAIVLLGIALIVVAAEGITGPLLTKEGDRYARSGSGGMATVVYFLAGVSPVWPGEKPAAKPGASGSASASPSASASGGAK